MVTLAAIGLTLLSGSTANRDKWWDDPFLISERSPLTQLEIAATKRYLRSNADQYATAQKAGRQEDAVRAYTFYLVSSGNVAEAAKLVRKEFTLVTSLRGNDSGMRSLNYSALRASISGESILLGREPYPPIANTLPIAKVPPVIESTISKATRTQSYDLLAHWIQTSVPTGRLHFDKILRRFPNDIVVLTYGAILYGDSIQGSTTLIRSQNGQSVVKAEPDLDYLPDLTRARSLIDRALERAPQNPGVLAYAMMFRPELRASKMGTYLKLDDSPRRRSYVMKMKIER